MKHTLKQLVERFRNDAKDTVEPYLFEDEYVKRVLNEAEHEAAIRARLLHECVLPQVCEITLQPGQSVYQLHEALYEITYLMRIEDGQPDTELALKSTEWLSRNHPEWRTDHKYVLPYAVQLETKILLATPPKAAGKLVLEGYRLPISTMTEDTDTPEIGVAHHEKLVLWALHCAFSQPDAESFDPQRAAQAERAFTAYFGARPDADLRRETREDTDHVNVSYI